MQLALLLPPTAANWTSQVCAYISNSWAVALAESPSFQSTLQAVASNSTMVAAYTQWADTLFDSDALWDALPGLSQPTLLAAGGLDSLVPPVNSERLAARIPGAQLKLYPDAGNVLTIGATGAQLAQDVDAFLAGVKA